MQVDPTAAGFCPAKLSKLDHHLISRYIEPKKISGFNLKIVRKGAVAQSASVGIMDIERNKSMRDDTIFRIYSCLLYTSPSPRDQRGSRMPSSA